MLYTDASFTLTAKSTIAAAKGVLQQGRTSIVICEYEFGPGVVEGVAGLRRDPGRAATGGCDIACGR